MTETKKDDSFFNVGIDSMGFYAPKNYIDLRDLAKVRNIDPNKYSKGLLTKEMRIPDNGEDIISMAVKAGQHALMKGNINPKDIDAIFIGTETMTYAVKSVSNILSEILDTSLNCVTQDVYNACAGATLAVLNAVGLVNDGIIKKALIIGADICSYKLESPGEPTQGAAAAALVISKNPRIAAFSKNFGKYSANIYDFYRLPHEEYPVVFGKFSINSYIRFQMGAFDDFFKNWENPLPDYLVFHSPFAKLPLKGLQNLLLKRWEIMRKILHDKTINQPCTVGIHEEACEYLNDLLEPVLEKIKNDYNITDINSIKNTLANNLRHMVLQTLNVPMSIGNMYSASIWAQLVYLLENIVNKNDYIYFGSYGSGATCISGMLKVMPEFKEIVNKNPTVNDFIKNKEQKTIKDYENLKKKIDAKNFNYAHIEPYESIENYFIEMSFCEEGCIVSKLEGFGFCPEGRNSTFKKKLPMYAVVTSDPIRNISEKEVNIETLVRVSPDVKKGQIVEYNLVRAGINESAACIEKGFINWVPTYKPLNHPIENHD